MRDVDLVTTDLPDPGPDHEYENEDDADFSGFGDHSADAAFVRAMGERYHKNPLCDVLPEISIITMSERLESATRALERASDEYDYEDRWGTAYLANLARRASPGSSDSIRFEPQRRRWEDLTRAFQRATRDLENARRADLLDQPRQREKGTLGETDAPPLNTEGRWYR